MFVERGIIILSLHSLILTLPLKMECKRSNKPSLREKVLQDRMLSHLVRMSENL